MASRFSICRTKWLLALVSLLGAVPAFAGHNCALYRGELNTVALPPPQCTSPIGLCTTGAFSGELNAAFDFRAEQMSPISPYLPLIMEYTGSIVLTVDAQNSLIITNQGRINTDPNTPGVVMDWGEIVGGTGAYEDAFGSVLILGIFNFATGTGQSHYRAHVCFPG